MSAPRTSALRVACLAAIVWSTMAGGWPVAAAPTELKLERVRLSGSLLRGPRAQFHPGEVVVVRFDVVGAALTPAGELALDTGIRISDSEGRVLADEPVAAGVRTPNLFAAKRIPCFFSIPPEIVSKPGAYTIKLRAIDRSAATPREARAEVTATLGPAGFHLGNQRITLDPQGAYEVGGPFRPGQTLFFCQNVVGYGVQHEAVDLQVDLEVRDRSGALLGKVEGFHRLTQRVTESPPFLLAAAFLSLTRPGAFEVRVTLKDKVLGTEDTAVYRITVVGTAGT